MRTPIYRSPWFKSILWPFGGTDARSYVEIDGDKLHVEFGFLFDERIPIDNIVSVARRPWSLLGGIGWRTNLIDSIALVGSRSNVVRLRLSPRVPMRLIWRMNVESLFVSVDDPDALVAELQRRIAARGK